uniref:Uncharacterized protein n=1 Tax=Cannabis sativa TaxID=3483 RepID=A0A803QSP9_CANSA
TGFTAQDPTERIAAPIRFLPTISSTLDSLFKVLFIFPRRFVCYLPSPDLAFDLIYRRLGLIPKQPDSPTNTGATGSARRVSLSPTPF